MSTVNNLKALSEQNSVAQDDNWLLSYLDVFVLITTLFLMLLVSTQHSDGQDSGYAQQGAWVVEDLPSLETVLKPVPEQSEQVQAVKLPDELAQLAEPALAHSATGEAVLGQIALQQALAQSISAHELGAHMQIVPDEFNTRLEIQSRVLFDSGNAFLTRSGEAVLEKLLPLLAEAPGAIVIEGHTDNRPINTARFPSNWNLAAARASEVLEFFVSEGFDAKRFRAVSYADTQPLVENSNDANRRKNRRVSIVIEQAR